MVDEGTKELHRYFPEEGLLGTLSTIARLKTLKRQGWLDAGIAHEACESVADHSFRCAIIALLTAAMTGADPMRLMGMTLIHDLPEALVGDLTPRDPVTRTEKFQREQDALHAILNPIHVHHRDFLIGLWEEFEAGESREAKLAREIDVLERTLQAFHYESEGAARESLEMFWEGVFDTIHEPLFRQLVAEALGKTGKS